MGGSGPGERGAAAAGAWLRSRRGASAVAAAWVLALGIDLLLHAGLLARLYAREDPFLLPAGRAFARIPAGYLTFLVLTLALAWLCARLGATSARAGARIGLVAGLVAWGSLCLGLWTIASAPADLLVGWALGQAAELAAGGAVLGAARGGFPLARLWRRVGAALALCIVLTVALQASGLAPAMELR